jgi:hypothetical protein
MPAATFGFHFFDPPPLNSDKLTLPGLPDQPPSFLVLFASSPDCLPIAQKLSEAGWLILAVDSQQPAYVELALDLISPPASPNFHWKWLKLAAIILIADEQPSVVPNPFVQPTLILPLHLHRLTRQLQSRGLSAKDIPYLLYVNIPNPFLSVVSTEAEEVALSSDHAPSEITPNTNSIFHSVVRRSRTSQGEELLAVIAEVTQIIFCAGCRRQIEPHEKALLLAPQLFCEGCASFPSAVIDRYPEERLPLFPARFLAKAARIFATSSASKRPPYPVLSSEEEEENTLATTSDPWSS